MAELYGANNVAMTSSNNQLFDLLDTTVLLIQQLLGAVQKVKSNMRIKRHCDEAKARWYSNRRRCSGCLATCLMPLRYNMALQKTNQVWAISIHLMFETSNLVWCCGQPASLNSRTFQKLAFSVACWNYNQPMQMYMYVPVAAATEPYMCSEFRHIMMFDRRMRINIAVW